MVEQAARACLLSELRTTLISHKFHRAAIIRSLISECQDATVMTIPVTLHLVPLAGFAGLMATAAFEDLRRLIIPNGLILALCVLWPLYVATAPMLTLVAAGTAALYAVAVFLVGALLFSRGLIGGGDVKLLAAATLWAGPAATISLFVLTSLLGGLLCLLLLTPIGALIAAARPIVGDPEDSAPARTDRALVPYGVAIAAAALIVTIPPNFNW
jgi:prepilin peptidase CpaA